MNVGWLYVAMLAVLGCEPGIYRSHANPPHDGEQWHSCADGTECLEGYACVREGNGYRCTWCGHDPNSRCALGVD